MYDKKTSTKTRSDVALAAVEKQFGKSAIMRLGDPSTGTEASFPTGCLSLDIALGIGGYPKGRVVELYGPAESGKTTMALHAIAEIQRQGGVAALIDVAHVFDPKYARDIGVALSDLLVSQPDTAEMALDIAETLVRSGAVDLIVMDSVEALTPRAEIEGEMDDAHVGLQARLMSQALRKLTAVASRTNTTVLFLNPLRIRPGVVFGSPETTSGGTALKYYSSVRLDVRRIGPLKIGDQVVGHRTRVKVVKNKLAAPFRTAEFDIRFGCGIDGAGDLLDLAVTYGVVEKSGAYFAYQGERLGQGRELARQVITASPSLQEVLRTATLAKAATEAQPA